MYVLPQALGKAVLKWHFVRSGRMPSSNLWHMKSQISGQILHIVTRESSKVSGNCVAYMSAGDGSKQQSLSIHSRTAAMAEPRTCITEISPS